MTNNQKLLEKYGAIIAEEVNVKSVSLLSEQLDVTKTFVPIGSKLSASFGKDTGRIIGAAKQGNAELISEGGLKVFQGDNERVLSDDQYEIRYSGLDESHQTVEDGAIVSLDLTITDVLKAEGVARELSRFLNQMRKDADYKVDQRIACFYETTDTYIQEVITTHSNFLQQEALLTSVEQGSTQGDRTDTVSLEEGSVTFTIKA